MCGQPPKGVVGSPSGSAPRRRVGRVGRGSHGCLAPRARPCRGPDALASLQVCWSAGAAQTRTEFTSRIVARVIDPEPPGGSPSARSCTIVASAAALAQLLVGQAKAVVRRKDSADAFYDDHRSAARPCHASAAARDPCGPPLLPQCEAGAAPSPELAPPARQRSPIRRADAVAQL